MIPSISTSEGLPVIFGPLSVILLLTALKDLFEDLKRSRQDKEENNKRVLTLGPAG